MSKVTLQDSLLRDLNDTARRLEIVERNLTTTPVETGIDDRNLLYEQPSPLQVWTINHPLGKYPSVDTFDQDGKKVEGDITYPSISQVVVTFSGPMSGKATLN